MKLITFLIFLSILSLTLERRLSRHKRHQTKYAVVWRSEFYNYCVVVESAYNVLMWNRPCQSLKTLGSKYNCSKEDQQHLQSNPHPTTIKKSVVDKNLPIDTRKAIFKASACLGKTAELVKKVGHKFTGVLTQKVRLINGFLRVQDPTLKFYEAGVGVVSMDPSHPHENSLKWAVEEFNKSQKVLKKSIDQGTPNPNNIVAEPIVLNDGDLTLERAELYVEQVVGSIYHQIIYICAKGKDRAYHFIADRSARDLTHEPTTLIKTWNKTMNGEFLKTLVRLAYYNASPDCDDEEQRPDAARFNPGFKIVAMGNATPDEVTAYLSAPRTEKFRSNYVSKKIPFHPSKEGNTNLKSFLLAIQRYAYRYKYYTPWNNCQHFATGFYNFLHGSHTKFFNDGIMDFMGVSKESFTMYFDFSMSDKIYKDTIKKID
jgi:hypothetical protein